MTHAFKLKLRCFMEGIEVPIVSCGVSVQPNAPAQFQVQIPATDRALEFKPRTLIHVFYYDYWEGPSPTATVRGSSGPQVITEEEMIENLRCREMGREEFWEGSREPLSTRQIPYARQEDAELEAAEEATGSDTVLPEEGAPVDAGPVHDALGTTGSRTDDVGRINPFAHGNPFEETRASYGTRLDLLEEDSKWKLLIGGEVIGFQFVKSPGQRAIILQCLDWSVYWDTCYQYKVNVASLTGDGMAAFVGAGTTFRDVFWQGDASSIAEAMTQRSVTQPELTGLLAGIVHLLECVGGVYTGNESNSICGPNPRNIRRRFKGVNDFFSIAELRLKLVYMIAAAENDDSSRRHYAAQAFAMWGRRYASRLGEIASFREILNVVMQYIYHAVYPQCGPRFVQARTTERTTVRRVTTSTSNIPDSFPSEISAVADEMRSVRDRILSTRARSFYTAATLMRQLDALASRCGDLAIRCESYNHRPPVSMLDRAKTHIRSTRAMFRPGDSVTEIVGAFYGPIGIEMDGAIAQVLAAKEYFNSRGGTTTRQIAETRTATTGYRLNQQVIRPDVFMVSPPRCNVLFPDNISSINYSRTFLREVTRMRLTVSDEIFGPDALLDQWYIAPDVEVMGAFGPRQLRNHDVDRSEAARTLQRAQFSKRIMEHELYTGVVPVFERMNEVNIYAARTDTVTYRGARIPYVTRAVNHQFFKHRWEPRQLQADGRFNPFIAAGFPVVVMDRYMTRDQVLNVERRGASYLEQSGGAAQAMADDHEDPVQGGAAAQTAYEHEIEQLDAWQILRDNVPNQFLGLAEGIQHNVTQTQATTSVMLTHARVHRESEELLTANEQTISRRSLLRRTGNTATTRGTPRRGQRRQEENDNRAYRETVVAALNPPEVGMVGPYYGEIVAVSQSDRVGSFPLFGTYHSENPRREWVNVAVETPMTARAMGDEAVTIVGDPDMEVTAHAYLVREAIDRWVGQEVSVPLEDFIRPPWMADVWRNDRIGATYQQLFGTGALTDPMVIDTGSVLTAASAADPLDDYLAYSNAEERRNVQDPIRADGASIQSAGMELTIERAVDLLVRSYSAIRHQPDLDVNEFIRAYTWRPAATLVDMLGSRDLAIDEEGNKVRGTEGLHSRAFGRGPLGSNLRNLVDRDARQVLGFDTEENRGNILERMDKRAEKAECVMAYVQELWDNRALLG